MTLLKNKGRQAATAPEDSPAPAHKAGSTLTRMRHVTLALVFALVIVSLAFDSGTGTPCSFGVSEFFLLCPLGAIEAMIAAKSLVPVTLISLAVMVVFSVLFGRSWCAWGCPVPALRRFFSRTPENDGQHGEEEHAPGCAALKQAWSLRESLRFIGRDKRTWTLLGVLIATLVAGFPIFCLICPVGLTFGTVGSLWHFFVDKQVTLSCLVFPLCLVIEVAFIRRWCTSICPIAGLLGIFGQFARLGRPVINAESCLRCSQGAACSVCTAVCSESIDKRVTMVSFGIVGCLGTLGIVAGGALHILPLFFVSTALTGVGTSALCLKAGRIYGSVSLSESLVAGGISLVVAAALYFVGVGLPQGLDLAFIAALPLLSSLLLSMHPEDPFTSVVHGDSESLPFKAPERRMLHRVIAATCVVAFTSGVGKGISTVSASITQFATSGTIAVFIIGAAGLVVVALINRARGAHGMRALYTILMVAGIIAMFATIFGFNIFYLIVGKELLWCFFTCFTAYIVFKFNLSAIRSFGIAQALYFASSFLGWVIGAAIEPYYVADTTARAAVGVLLAGMVMATLLFVLTEADIKRIVEWSFEGLDAEHLEDGIVVATGANAGSIALTLEEAVTDDLSHARDPRYGLSTRELEILAPFAQGRSANWIADHFIISKNTVRTHLRNSYNKLGVHNRQELLDFLAGHD
ncbi:MAG: LuxR C-terminal-related transcriptional regulator [Coriobacteriales bacterium]